MGSERGRGEGVSLQATWDQSGQGSHHTQRRDSKYLSKRDSGTGEGSSGRRGIIKGVNQGFIRGIVPCALV
jgi:hypothetical protein